MAIRQRICPQCSRQFEYKVGRGNDRRFCSIRCTRDAAIAKQKVETSTRACSVEGCNKPPRSAGSLLCEMHYGRLRRNGHMTLLAPMPEREHSDGYIIAYAPGHPLCTEGRNEVYQHRKVYFDAHGQGPFTCHVCGAPQSWETMHVDHLDFNPKNNEIGNLAPACPECNQWRDKDRRVVAGQAKAELITALGEKQSITEWSRRSGVPRSTIARRIADGWPVELAINIPSGPTGRKYSI